MISAQGWSQLRLDQIPILLSRWIPCSRRAKVSSINAFKEHSWIITLQDFIHRHPNARTKVCFNWCIVCFNLFPFVFPEINPIMSVGFLAEYLTFEDPGGLFNYGIVVDYSCNTKEERKWTRIEQCRQFEPQLTSSWIRKAYKQISLLFFNR